MEEIIPLTHSCLDCRLQLTILYNHFVTVLSRKDFYIKITIVSKNSQAKTPTEKQEEVDTERKEPLQRLSCDDAQSDDNRECDVEENDTAEKPANIDEAVLPETEVAPKSHRRLPTVLKDLSYDERLRFISQNKRILKIKDLMKAVDQYSKGKKKLLTLSPELELEMHDYAHKAKMSKPLESYESSRQEIRAKNAITKTIKKKAILSVSRSFKREPVSHAPVITDHVTSPVTSPPKITVAPQNTNLTPSVPKQKRQQIFINRPASSKASEDGKPYDALVTITYKPQQSQTNNLTTSDVTTAAADENVQAVQSLMSEEVAAHQEVTSVPDLTADVGRVSLEPRKETNNVSGNLLFLVPKMNAAVDYTKNPSEHPNYKKIRQHCQCVMPLCGEKFDSVGALRKHRKKEHKDEKGRLKCPTCPFTGTCVKLLIHHYQSYHEDTVRHCCEVCGEAIKSDRGLKMHKLRRHGGEEAKKERKTLRCHLCDFRCLRKEMRAHLIEKHKTTSTHTCQTCGKTFPHVKYLRKHEQSHSRDKPFKCKYCSFAARFSSNLSTHMRKSHPDIHRREMQVKFFQCRFCSFHCNDRGVMTRHMKLHV